MDHTWLSAGVDCIEKVKFSEQSELVAIDEKEYKYSKVEKRSSSEEGEVRTIWKCAESGCHCKIGIVGEFITKRYNIHKHPPPSPGTLANIFSPCTFYSLLKQVQCKLGFISYSSEHT